MYVCISRWVDVVFVFRQFHFNLGFQFCILCDREHFFSSFFFLSYQRWNSPTIWRRANLAEKCTSKDDTNGWSVVCFFFLLGFKRSYNDQSNTHIYLYREQSMLLLFILLFFIQTHSLTHKTQCERLGTMEKNWASQRIESAEISMIKWKQQQHHKRNTE